MVERKGKGMKGKERYRKGKGIRKRREINNIM